MNSCISKLVNTQIDVAKEVNDIYPSDCYDVNIKFCSAEDLPRTDAIGHCDPYFVATIDDQVSFTSSILHDTTSPVWTDGMWKVLNIPNNAKLSVLIYDKYDPMPVDDYLGSFKISSLVNYEAPTDGHAIFGRLEKYCGRFHLCISAVQSSIENQHLPRYTYDGPCRYIRHDDFLAGHLAHVNSDCIYSTWKISMRRINFFFHPDQCQHWNTHVKNAQTIFSGGPLSSAIQATIKFAHRSLFRTTLMHADKGLLTNSDDLWKLVFTNKVTQRIHLCVYTYIIDDSKWRFSETGDKFFVDFASKHALLANACEYVRYAGQFHPRPKYGWDRLDDEWELVFDNASGTYTPTTDLFENLKKFFLFNFPGLNIVTYDFKDPLLKESLEQLKLASKKQQCNVNE